MGGGDAEMNQSFKVAMFHSFKATAVRLWNLATFRLCNPETLKP
jgi:hypothetical protein